jgi:serralysin
MAIIDISGGGNFTYGSEANRIHVLAALNAEPQYNVFTLGGADLLDFRDANAGNTHYAYAGAGRDTVLGGAANETVGDQSGNDLMILRGGTDVVFMGRGNDTVNGGGGSDWVYFTQLTDDVTGAVIFDGGVVCDLNLTGAQNFGVFGKDRLTGIENAAGSYGKDRLSGTGGDNHLEGFAGNDTLVGRGGRDLLNGDAGRDLLIGGTRWDSFLLGDADGARDIVRYAKMNESGTNDILMESQLDNVIQFQAAGAGYDRFDFAAIDARAGTPKNDSFIFRGTGAFLSAGGEIRLVEKDGDTVIYLDNDADAAAEMVILVTGAIGLTVDNFIL